MKAALRILGPILLAFLVVACPVLERLDEELPVQEIEVPDSDSGALVIDLSSIFASVRTLIPDRMTISRCDITGTPQGGGAGFTASVGPGQTFSRAGLAVGSWTIEIDAVNPNDIVVGHGEKTVEIKAGSTTSAQITILPVSGTGTLDLTLTWDKQAYKKESITLHLSPEVPPGGELDVKNGLGTYLHEAVPSGYYVLTIQLIGDDVMVWGTMEAVWIVAGLITEKTWNNIAP